MLISTSLFIYLIVLLLIPALVVLVTPGPCPVDSADRTSSRLRALVVIFPAVMAVLYLGGSWWASAIHGDTRLIADSNLLVWVMVAWMLLVFYLGEGRVRPQSSIELPVSLWLGLSAAWVVAVTVLLNLLSPDDYLLCLPPLALMALAIASGPTLVRRATSLLPAALAQAEPALQQRWQRARAWLIASLLVALALGVLLLVLLMGMSGAGLDASALAFAEQATMVRISLIALSVVPVVALVYALMEWRRRHQR